MQDVLSLGFFLSLRNFYKRRFEIGVKIAVSRNLPLCPHPVVYLVCILSP